MKTALCSLGSETRSYNKNNNHISDSVDNAFKVQMSLKWINSLLVTFNDLHIELLHVLS